MSLKQEMFHSKNDSWETPDDLFAELDDEFHFTLDACANSENKKCDVYFTKEKDGLLMPWEGVVWCNPPYGHSVGRWVQKASESAKGDATVVMLLFARTDTKWFHEYIYNKPGVEVRFIKGRLRFKGAKHNAFFPSMIVIFRGYAE